jgi:nitrite reductase/ring-hydroxylating ferredoxin subunit
MENCLSDDAALLALCDVTDVAPDKPFKVELDGEALAVFEIAGKYYVTQDHCTHGPGSLSEGYVDGEEIECPFHLGRFSILSGEATGAPCTIPLRTWHVTVRDGRICIDRMQHASA